MKVGKYRCFFKNDWKNGLLNLALGSDDQLKALAETENAGPADAAEQAKLADGWWELADKLTGIARHNVQLHAARWYRSALPELEGLELAKAESRIKVVTPAAPAETTRPAARSKLVIKRAIYGALPSGKFVDVTDKVAKMVKDNTLSVEASNAAFGDPASGASKTLRVDYILDGVEKYKAVGERKVLTIGAGGE
jgi:hypothetical protein